MPSRTRVAQQQQQQQQQQCEVCRVNTSKYRCSQCTVRYCSVPCYKQHKELRHQDDIPPEPKAGNSRIDQDVHTTPSTTKATAQQEQEEAVAAEHTDAGPSDIPLRPLTSLSWPPEPDESIFTDPLRKEDPKPLRHAELLRIAQSKDLRHLLTSSPLPRILGALDGLPTPGARSAMLARCLSIDPISLSAPTSAPSADLLSQRDSPPPIEDLIRALAGRASGDADEEITGGHEQKAGFWIGRASETDRVWVGEEERRIMRVFAGLVCKAIDGGEGDGWGQGELGWEV